MFLAPYKHVHGYNYVSLFYRVLGDHGREFSCLDLPELGKHYWQRLLLLNVAQHFSMSHLQLWLLNGEEKVSEWFGACSILPELMLPVQFSLMRSTHSAILVGKIPFLFLVQFVNSTDFVVTLSIYLFQCFRGA